MPLPSALQVELDWEHSTSASYRTAGWLGEEPNGAQGETFSLQKAGDLHMTWALPLDRGDQ